MYRHILLMGVCLLCVTRLPLADTPVVSLIQRQPKEVLLSPGGRRVGSTLDDPQPDTLVYDDGTPAVYFSMSGHWARVRFTAPLPFELRSIYFYTTNPDSSAAPCSLFVHASNNGNLGAILGWVRIQACDSCWNDVNLPSPIRLEAGQDVFVVIGPGFGNPQTHGWRVMLDHGNDWDRSCVSNAHYGGYITIGADWLIRAGGVLEIPVDVAATECYNTVSRGSAGRFFLLPGDTVTLHGQINNNGSAVPNYSVRWSVLGPAGTEVFSNQVIGSGLPRNGIVQVTASQAFQVMDEGEYLARCIAHVDSDAVSDNDTAMLRFFAGGLNQWFRYDDNSPDGPQPITPPCCVGLSFAPTIEAAFIDSVRIYACTTGTADLAIWLNDTAGCPSSLIWSQTPGLTEGWCTYGVLPPVLIFGRQTFTVAFTLHDARLAVDESPPVAAGISHMPAVTWLFDDGWTRSGTGNWCIQALVDSCPNPHFAVIAISPSDTLRFSEVVGREETRMITIHNYGQDTLRVDNMVFSPELETAFAVVPTTVTVDAGDSALVAVNFRPEQSGDLSGTLRIENNSLNAPHKILIILANAYSAVELNQRHLPTTFALNQNYPNPLNASTEITFALPTVSDVHLEVYNLLGQEVGVLVEAHLAAGSYRRTFDASPLPGGLYLCRLKAGSFTETRKMLLLK